jgi:uncharacterized protein YybS (DUF2232 family)
VPDQAHHRIASPWLRRFSTYTTTGKKALFGWLFGFPLAVFLFSFAVVYAAGVPYETSVGYAAVLMSLSGVQSIRMFARVLSGDYVQKHQQSAPLCEGE